MIQIEDFQKETLRDLEHGYKFMGNDPHYGRGPFRFLNYTEDRNNIVVYDCITGEKRVLDLRAVLRGFDCQEYVWC